MYHCRLIDAFLLSYCEKYIYIYCMLINLYLLWKPVGIPVCLYPSFHREMNSFHREIVEKLRERPMVNCRSISLNFYRGQKNRKKYTIILPLILNNNQNSKFFEKQNQFSCTQNNYKLNFAHSTSHNSYNFPSIIRN